MAGAAGAAAAPFAPSGVPVIMAVAVADVAEAPGSFSQARRLVWIPPILVRE